MTTYVIPAINNLLASARAQKTLSLIAQDVEKLCLKKQIEVMEASFMDVQASLHAGEPDLNNFLLMFCKA